MNRLKRIRIRGFRSLREVELELGPRTVLVGPNGAGKSNFLSVLHMVSLMRTQSLQRFVGEQGGASNLLHYGPSVTPELEMDLEFDTPQGPYAYHGRLGYGAGDTLVYLGETITSGRSDESNGTTHSIGAGHRESALLCAERMVGQDDSPEKRLASLIDNLSSFHFHDTSATSPMRQNARSADARNLRSDGSNLAAFLYALRTGEVEQEGASWRLIEGLVRRLAPFIKRLEPEPTHTHAPNAPIRLYWVDERDHRFDVHDLSDGTLRALALITALAQPASTLPAFICIDEPELGLHPTAIELVASLARSVSSKAQVVLSTQSPALLDEFDPEDVVIVERAGHESRFRRLDAQALSEWLDEYSLSELYDKNVLGGRP